MYFYCFKSVYKDQNISRIPSVTYNHLHVLEDYFLVSLVTHACALLPPKDEALCHQSDLFWMPLANAAKSKTPQYCACGISSQQLLIGHRPQSSWRPLGLHQNKVWNKIRKLSGSSSAWETKKHPNEPICHFIWQGPGCIRCAHHCINHHISPVNINANHTIW